MAAANLVFCHGDDVVDVAANVLKVQWPDRLRAQAIGQRAGDPLRRKLHDLAFAKALLRVVGQFRFHADDLRLRAAQLDRAWKPR